MTGQCTATKRDGSPCTLPSNAPSGLCWAHDPKNAERRRRGQSRGGKSKPSRELVRLQARFEELAEGVLEGTIEKGAGAIAGQLLNGARACMATRLKAVEQEEILERVAELETLVQRQRDERRRGA